ncbi:MAG TPA: NAD(P)H-dependent glycerol-3-phosphate dehydrogenase [Pseudogracilibacillus sp.]|nr:NAD(P)H-dependent glycerol-3-phosphate dehydrogenase [Pseudogracilibacillus sp.]
MKKIAVLGAGSWGTALSMVLHDSGQDVRLWTHREAQAEEINQQHTNKSYVSVDLPEGIIAYHDLKAAIKDTDAILFVVPSKAVREICAKIKDDLPKNVTIIHASKGIEPGTHKRISEIILEELPDFNDQNLAVLSGPSHAEEVALRHPTTVTVASKDEKCAAYVQNIFINKFFRVYTSKDVIGVELGGALKNIIALGAGISDGLGFGDNAKAALITRGLAEITRLGNALGANPMTFLGLCGVGDLIVTCTSVHSRNWRAGNMIGKGDSLDDILEKMGMVVEGVRTTKAAYQLSVEEDVDMPITSGIYDILVNDEDPKEMVSQLMNRNRKEEFDQFNMQQWLDK